MIDGAPLNGGEGFPFGGLLNKSGDAPENPKAYLNILVFDKNLGFVDGAFVPVTTAAKEDGSDVPHEKLSKEIIVNQPGYVYIYLSNDNPEPMEVYFDDFEVEHAHSTIVQADDYYPFGLSFNSYKRENSVENRFLYNDGSELQDDLGLGVYQTQFRMLDPAKGRWWQIDPKASEKESPYVSMGNNPILYHDPLGTLYVMGILPLTTSGQILIWEEI